MRITPRLLKLIRYTHNHKQKHTAALTGYAEDTIKKYEHGAPISKEATIRILEAYSLDSRKLDELYKKLADYEAAGLL